ncbi:MAG TPA: cell wall hydrolase [Burkholderiales bacterium]|jgi:N-acetylmuramoyl-L-alanine amidase|nr:cell wall hydrolase [Burkholderiales bacterium]
MLWKLRLWWYRTDIAAWAFVSYFALVVGALVFAAGEVFKKRDAERGRVREFHARSLDCLARNVYYEARGETAAGQYAVAEVTMNRKASPFYPKTVCDVVYQREAFSWTDSIDLETPAGPAWQRAQKIADEVYYQRRPPTMSGVLHFHAVYVQPDWSKERRRVARIGRHVFYR